MPKPTIRSIAKKARLSNCTVSLALRGNTKISLGTRTRVQSLAHQMGYRLNPVVASWMAHVRSTKSKVSFQGSLALLDFHSGSLPLSGYSTPRRQIEGARRRAEELGYRLEHLPVFKEQWSPERLTQILYSRGIKGALIPASAGLGKIDFSFESFALAVIGHRVTNPQLHFTSNDQYATMLLACEEMIGLGYKRIGLILPHQLDCNVENRFSAAFWAWQQRQREDDRVPPFVSDINLSEGKLVAWCRNCRPDGILHFDMVIPHETPRTILSRHFRIPEDFGLAALDWIENETGMAGVDQNHELAGAAAVDLVVAQLQNNEYGIPTEPRGVFLESTWRPGATAPPLHGKKR